MDPSLDYPRYLCLPAHDHWTAVLFSGFSLNHCILIYMEPAETVQEAIRLQGVRLGPQAGEISALHQGMEAIRANIQHLVERLIPQIAAPPTSLPPPGIPPRPHLPAPERYEGDPGSCRSFLSTCSLVFKLQSSSIPTERSRVAYVITILSGRAREWGTAVWEANTPECQTFSQFAQAYSTGPSLVQPPPVSCFGSARVSVRYPTMS